MFGQLKIGEKGQFVIPNGNFIGMLFRLEIPLAYTILIYLIAIFIFRSKMRKK